MNGSVPDHHRQLLEAEILHLRGQDFAEIVRLFDAKHGSEIPASDRLAKQLHEQLTKLRRLWGYADQLNTRQQQVTMAAMSYFLREDDLVEDSHPAGHIDDALVIETAMAELQMELSELLN
ncbi:MAG: hypothetical protein ACR2IE_17200 [Candidatus Sumerlaeaceae bacterium]